ncbi:MAG: clostripain-related cysteine peptidase [Candidatus Pelethousia sp.]|nr:clostripain-related cysteine peptidase [Candidatus Pelethousia sp.]
MREADWTVLIYANGNNDLASEMRKIMADAEKVGANERVHVAIQIASLEPALLKEIRREFNWEEPDGWSGVRRYYIHKGKSKLLEEFGNVNMADPRQLLAFLQWGISSFPAAKYMLSLCGHSYQFVGLLTDYSLDAPYIMGIAEAVRAINLAANGLGKKIDILLLDTCYANSLELLYELGMEESHAVQTVLTYLGSGPVEGMPYDAILHVVEAAGPGTDRAALLKMLVARLPCNLVSFSIDYQKLQQIKRLFHEKTMEYWTASAGKGQAASALSTADQLHILRSISSIAPPIYLYYKSPSAGSSLIAVASGMQDNFNLLSYYDHLGFAKNNCWATLLRGRPGACPDPAKAGQDIGLSPLKMSPREVFESISIMNPNLDPSQIRLMLEALYRSNNWVL